MYSSYLVKLDSIRAHINNASLMAVSKTRSIEEIMNVYECGQKLFGENHVQEITDKFKDGHPADMRVHMIGHLQKNKVNKVVPLVDMIESVDSFELLSKIDKAAFNCSKVMPVLLEYNTSGEESKSGFSDEESLFDCLVRAKELKNVTIQGLMTVGPLGNEETKTRLAFRQLRELSEKCRAKFPCYEFKTLSMGMSGDWKIAVEEGSTQVRIGTAIFGERNYV